MALLQESSKSKSFVVLTYLSLLVIFSHKELNETSKFPIKLQTISLYCIFFCCLRATQHASGVGRADLNHLNWGQQVLCTV